MKQITGPSIAFLDERFVNVEDWFLMPPVEDWHDPTGGLPVDPDVGDRYIAEETANGWTQDYIYEWDGDEWIESVPEEGWMVWMLFSLIFYVFFSGGWMEVGNNSFLRLDATNDPVTGAIQFQNATDSTTAFQILDADGGTPIVNVDTTNERVGIGTETPDTKLQVVGDTKFGDDNTNYTTFESDGTLQAIGTATAFDDIRVPLSSIKRLGFADPSWVQFADDGAASVGVYALSFSNTVDQEVYFSIQIPHNWKLGTNLDAHVHWSPSDTSTNSVTWKLEYTVANINGTFGNTSTLSITDAGDGTAKKHQYADLGDIDLSAYTANTDVSIMLMCRLYRDVSDGDDYAAGAFLLEADFHYEIDTLGSRTELTK